MSDSSSSYSPFDVVGTMTVPAGMTRLYDLGLSVALHLWTEELNRGEVEHWHRFAVEVSSLRNDLNRIDLLDVTEPAIDVPVRVATWAALVSATLSCAPYPSLADACVALRHLATEAEQLVHSVPNDVESGEQDGRGESLPGLTVAPAAGVAPQGS